MGRIKTKLAKRLTHKLLEMYPEKFSKDLEVNKKSVGALLIGASKKIRNMIAGYVTRIMKRTETA